MKRKQEKLTDALQLVDDAYVWEARPERKFRSRTGRAALLVACLSVLLTLGMIVSLALWLFLPFGHQAPDVSRYRESEYYEVIQQLNELTYQKPSDKNNFERLFGGLLLAVGEGTNGSDFWGGLQPAPEAPSMSAPSSTAPGGAPGSDTPDGAAGEAGNGYVEVTDNQVEGVIEGDLFKRSRTHLFYMHDSNLYAYSIDKENSAQVGVLALEIVSKGETGGYDYYMRFYPREMYLSQDGSTVTLLANEWRKESGVQHVVISVDVSDPTQMEIAHIVRIKGNYSSSRVVDGKLLLMSDFYVGSNPDFSDEAAFLPQIDTGDGWQSIPVEDIILPDTLTSARYTVVTMLDEMTLQTLGFSAFLSWGNTFYVSPTTIYAGRGVSVREEQQLSVETYTTTEIFALDYAGEGFVHRGSVRLDGRLKDQYSMDEYNGILRVVTTTDHTLTQITGDNASTSGASGSSASLFCVDLETMEIVAAVENFAPLGETVESVRFDGESAYVCTAVVVTLTDPVFFFDLSDLDNITYTDTGVIEGYSSSLINFGDGLALGIGIGDSWDTFKLEVYEQDALSGTVVSVDAWEQKSTQYSTEYKSYLIDREKALVGMGLYCYDSTVGGSNGMEYYLWHFDGYHFRLLHKVPLKDTSAMQLLRSVIIDDYLYILHRGELVVIAVQYDGQGVQAGK